MAETGQGTTDFTPRKLAIAFACLIGLMLAGGGFAQGAIALVMAPLRREFHWSSAAIGLALTLMTWASAAAIPFAGRYVDRVGARRFLIVAAALITAVTAALGFSSSSLLQFYACFIVLGVLGASTVGYTKIISALFTRHRGKAFALFTAEATIVAAILPQLMKVFLEHDGWRGVFLWLAAIKLVVALPILLFMLRDPAASGTGPGARPPPELVQGFTLGETLRRPVFWMIVAANAGGGLVIYGLMPHLVQMMRTRGLGLGQAVGAMSLMAAATAAGQLASGVIIDRFSTPKVSGGFLVLFLTGIVLLSRASAATGAWPLYLGVVLMGVGGGSQQPMRNYFFTRYFGLKAFGSVLGVFTAVQQVLTAPAPFVLGLIFDRTGSYALAFPMFMAAAVLSITVFMLLPPYRFTATPTPAPGAAGEASGDVGHGVGLGERAGDLGQEGGR